MRRHDIDPVSLTFGVLFVGFAAAWALVAGDVANLSALRVVIPLVLVCAGIAGVIGPRRSAVGSAGAEAPPSTDRTEADDHASTGGGEGP